VKLEMFHLAPYRGLPEDFREEYRSVWVDVPRHLFDPKKAHEYYNETLDELVKEGKIQLTTSFELTLSNYGVEFSSGKPSKNIAKTIEVNATFEF